ncbi:hypothetical protein FXO37_26230 [Capsicum annuum]|nr:hypothetical protein FXO37_26230 [Capsicum annuum]
MGSHFVEENMEGLVRLCPANHIPLTPLSFMERAAFVYRKNIALIHENISYSWEELHERCVKLASALSQLGGVTHGHVFILHTTKGCGAVDEAASPLKSEVLGSSPRI